MSDKIKKFMPSVREANIIAKDLNRKVKFSAKLINILPQNIKDPQLLALEQKSDILVTVHNNENGMVYHWNREKFQNRLDIMRELDQQFYDEGEIEPLDEQSDPFWDPPQAQKIGQGYYVLKTLAYLIDNPVTIKIIGDEQQNCGRLQANIIPLDETGQQDPPQDELPQEPKQLIGQNIHFSVQIIRAIDLPAHFCKNVHVEYKIFKEEQTHQTIVVKGKNQNPQFNFSKFHQNYMVTEKFLDYLLTSTLCFKVYGFRDSKPKKTQEVTRPAIHQIVQQDKGTLKGHNDRQNIKSTEAKEVKRKQKKQNQQMDFKYMQQNQKQDLQQPLQPSQQMQQIAGPSVKQNTRETRSNSLSAMHQQNRKASKKEKECSIF